MARFYDFVQDALAEGQPFALGIIAGIKGSSPQKKGAKALFFADGRGAENVRLSFSLVDETLIDDGIERLASLV